MIDSVRMVGWKSHEDSRVEFSEGTNVLVGIMGSGKSSVLQALTYGLYGDLPGIRSRKISLNGLIMRNPRRMEEAKIEVKFSAGDSQYTVRRKVTENGSEAKLLRDGKILESGVRRVTRQVEELLGTDYETFINVVYAQQNQIDQFLRYGKTERVKLIDGILKIDKIEDARKQLRTFHTTVKNRLKDLRERASKDVSDSKTRLKEIRRRIEELEGELSDLQSVISSLSDDHSAKKLKFKEMERIRDKREEISSRINHLKGEKSSLQERLESLPEIEGASKKLQKKESGLEKAKSAESEAISRLAEARSDVKQAEARLEDLEGLKEIADKDVKEWGPKLEEVRAKLSRKEAEAETHRRSIEQLSSADARCPVCDSELEDPKEHVKRHDSALKSLNTEIESLQEELGDLKSKKSESDDLRLEIARAKERLKDAPGLRKRAEKDLSGLESTRESAREKVTYLEREVEELRKATEREESRHRLDAIKEELESLLHKMRGLPFNKSDFKELREEIEALGNKLASQRTRMQDVPTLISSHSSEAKAIERELKEVQDAKSEVKRVRRKMESLSVLINSLYDVQVLVRRRFLELVNELLSDVWGRLYPYGDYSSLRVHVESDGRRTGDYVLQLRERRGWVDVEGVASGGERSIASLALRVAFAKALSKLGLILLDEPTHNLDNNGINKLTDVLREGMPSVLEQVVVITHEERMEKAATGGAYRLDRDKERGLETRVERL